MKSRERVADMRCEQAIDADPARVTPCTCDLCDIARRVAKARDDIHTLTLLWAAKVLKNARELT